VSKSILTEHTITEHFGLAEATSSIFSICLIDDFLRVYILESHHSFYLASCLVAECIRELSLLGWLINFGFELGSIFIIFIDFFL